MQRYIIRRWKVNKYWESDKYYRLESDAYNFLVHESIERKKHPDINNDWAALRETIVKYFNYCHAEQEIARSDVLAILYFIAIN